MDGNLTEGDHAFGATIDKASADFTAAMDDDFNTAGGIAAIFEFVKAANIYLSEANGTQDVSVTIRAADMLDELTSVLGIDLDVQESDLPQELVSLAKELAGYIGEDIEEAAERLLAARQEARAAKKWAVADDIRNAISALGLIIEDTPQGSRLHQ
jgi:cysteinyl-tRNA synthetase